MKKVLFNDGIDKSLYDELIAFGVEVVDHHYYADELLNIIGDFDVLVVRSATKVTKEVISAAKGKNLKLIIRAGVGTDNIDVNYAVECGITVRNTPGASSSSVAELVLAHMFSLSRFLNQSNVTMRNGEWNKKRYEGCELLGKTLGIVGMGRIGKSLAIKANALGMKVIYFDALGKVNSNFEYEEMDNLLADSDYISIHVPSTKILIGEREIKKMKDGAYIINTSRGSVIDNVALVKALDSGKILGAGLDVFESEPNFDINLVNHPRVSATPHIGAATREAQNRIGAEIVAIIKEELNL